MNSLKYISFSMYTGQISTNAIKPEVAEVLNLSAHTFWDKCFQVEFSFEQMLLIFYVVLLLDYNRTKIL